MARTGVYLGNSPFHAGSVSLVLNNRTGHVSPQYHVVFDYTFSTMEDMRKGAVPGNLKTDKGALIACYAGKTHS